MNYEFVKSIEKSQKKLKEDFNNALDDILNSIDGYSELNEDCKNICKIFVCINILYKLDKEKCK